MRSRAADDGAQLMMLAGIVLTLAFIMTALTLAQVAALEKEAAQDTPSPILGEWRFLHDRLASNVETAITPETSRESLKESIMPTLSATFRALAAEKGYDFVLRLAGDGNFEANGNEASLINDVTGKYDEWSYDGAVHFEHDAADDPDVTDGILWQVPCPDDGPLGGCIGGVYLFLRLQDGTTSIEESVLFAVNRP